jgi:hypothetical protein
LADDQADRLARLEHRVEMLEALLVEREDWSCLDVVPVTSRG